ncbi:MAG: T9SS type A sorting domain-containing protein [Ignavibacteriaceae bacterium]
MKTIASYFITGLFVILVNNINHAQPAGLDLIWEKEVDVKTMKFTPDGELLVTGGASNVCQLYRCGNIKVWDVADSALLLTVEGWLIGYTNDIDISSDGQRVVSAHGGVYCNAFTGCVRDRAGQYEHGITGSQLYGDTNPDGIIYSIAFSPDQSIIAAGTGYNNSGHINIYDSQYNLLRTLPGHSGNTSSLLFTPDGQYLISGGADGSIRVWNYLDGTFIQYLQHGTYLNGGRAIQLSISPDGQYLASTGDGYNLNIKIWKTSDWSVVHTFEAGDPYGSNGYTDFTPNGIYLGVRVSYISNQDHIRFYKVETGELVREYIDTTSTASNQNSIRALAFSPTANNNFAYSVGYGNSGKLKYVATDLNLVDNQVTPVELASFSADVNVSNVTLNWVTSSELNNTGFEIERLQDYKISKLQNWEKIGFVEGNGTTTETKHYYFIDEEVSAGIYNYRLKQIDLDGTYEYSNVIEVEIKIPETFSLSQNYPNPFNPSTQIEYSIPTDGFVSLTIYNSIGQAVSTLVNENQSAGKYSITFSDKGLSSGLYFYTLRNGEFSITKKMLLLR